MDGSKELAPAITWSQMFAQIMQGTHHLAGGALEPALPVDDRVARCQPGGQFEQPEDEARRALKLK